MYYQVRHLRGALTEEDRQARSFYKLSNYIYVARSPFEGRQHHDEHYYNEKINVLLNMNEEK